ncbi:DUF2637 domain-containing protein [Nocardia sp. NPDC060259]|uniref:DUF2637 domain-containing protein n=1 Tax=Nocardia sp. NPDC060259 TaxID=3347088 RepID=UPI0036687536
MTTITAAVPADDTVGPDTSHREPHFIGRLSSFRPRMAHASLIVTAVVAVNSFQMSFAALHDLSIRNLVPPELAANVPIAIVGLVAASIIATASFSQWSAGWWYATVLFAFSTLISVSGNIQYANEIGGGVVSMSIYAGMPLTMLFAVHLTLMLWERGRQVSAECGAEAAEPEPTVAPVEVEVEVPKVYPLDNTGPLFTRRQATGVGSPHWPTSVDVIDGPQFTTTGIRF